MTLPFFTSDTHFCHGFMQKHRGYDSVPALNDAMIETWNRTVPIGKHAHVYHLGDLSFAGYSKTAEILEALNGTIHIIPGNHDNDNTMRRLHAAGLIVLEPPLMDLKVGIAKPDGTNDVHRFTLCHFPLLVWNRAQYGAMHLHGHSHGSARYPKPEARILDVGWDVHLRPLTTKRVLEIMAERRFGQLDGHKEQVAHE